MLDDLKFIHERDAQDALGFAEKQWQQLQHDYQFSFDAGVEIQNVVVAGMGGSALAALIAGVWPGLSVPFEIVRQYDIPQYVGTNTLFIASSFSGNTEETLTAVTHAEERGARIVCISHGGRLQEIAQERGYPSIVLPAATQPRYAAFYGFRAFLEVLIAAGLAGRAIIDELADASEWLKDQSAQWAVTVPTAKNQAKTLAQELIGRSIVVYSGPKLYPAAYNWKISFNENAKQVAWVNQYPEFNHNEFLGWTKQPVNKPYAVIDIRSSLEHERVQKRFEVSERLLSGVRPAPEIVLPEGKTLLKQLLWAITLGNFTSLYLALLNNLNPSPVDIIEKLKKSLDD